MAKSIILKTTPINLGDTTSQHNIAIHDLLNSLHKGTKTNVLGSQKYQTQIVLNHVDY